MGGTLWPGWDEKKSWRVTRRMDSATEEIKEAEEKKKEKQVKEAEEKSEARQQTSSPSPLRHFKILVVALFDYF